MKPFPSLVSIIFLLSGVLVFLMGVWLFLAGILVSLPNLSMILLVVAGSLMAFQGAFYWGKLGQLPSLILPHGEDHTDRQRFLLGGAMLLWSWLSLSLGLLASIKLGYGCELLGCGAIFSVERQWRLRGVISVNFYLVKTGFAFLVCAGLVLALIAQHASS